MVTGTNQHIISYFLKCCPKIRSFKKIKENCINKAFIELFLSENCLDTPNYLYVKIRAHEKSSILIAKAKTKINRKEK